MKRIMALVIAPLSLLAPAFADSASASAETSRPVARASVPGSYTLYYKWNQTKFGHGPIVLKANHKGSDKQGNVIAWSRTGASITFVLDAQATQGATATYTGVITTTGLCSRQSHCHMQNNVGGSGEWYADKALA